MIAQHQIPGFILFEPMLGQGGFGWVYKAFSIQLGSIVALKVLRTPSSDALIRFRREIQIIEKLKNERFIVTVLTHDLTHNPPYYVMELCKGSIADLLKASQQPLPWKICAGYLAQAASGLTSLHQAGGFHRDIKPANLLISNDNVGWPTLRLADFGLARHPSTNTGPITQQAGGTDGYMSPEVVNGEAYSAADDIYSLGISGIEMLTLKRLPYGFENPQISPYFQAILRAMVGPRAGRPLAKEVMQGCLKAIIAGGVKPAATPPPPNPTASGRNDNLAALLIGALIIAGIVIATSD